MFAKLYCDILFSSVWEKSKDTRLLWVTFLAMADQDGVVRASLPGLARAANLTLEETKVALIPLMAPDPESKSQKEEGRRITRIPDGFLVVNYVDYRNRKTAAERREETRKRVAEHRKRVCPVAHVTKPVTHVTKCNPSEAEAEAEAETESPLPPLSNKGDSKTDIGSETDPQSTATEAVAVDGPPFREIMIEWNKTAQANKLPTVNHLNEKRMMAIRARWRDVTWRENWKKALEVIPKSPFLLGDNGRGWRANFVFFLRPDSVDSILEGTYEQVPQKTEIERMMEEVMRRSQKRLATQEEPTA